MSDVDTYSSEYPLAAGESDAFTPSRGGLDGLTVALTL
jgi:hypothetical protein